MLAQIAAIDLEGLPKLVLEYVMNKPAFALPPDVQPAPYYQRNAKQPGRAWDEEKYRAAGEKMLRESKVAAFVVAGGQGSRLGYEGPKGCYPAGAETGKPLFGVFADGLLGLKDRHGVTIPWYVMTSPLNHRQTVEFFEHSNYFGLDRSSVMLFPQGVMPSLDIKTGKVLLAGKDEAATNPDGHGGSLKALHVSGAAGGHAAAGRRNDQLLPGGQPDRTFPGPGVSGPARGGPESSAQMSSKMVVKASPEEKVGVFCMAGAGSRRGVEIVEYSDLPMEYQRQANPDGSLRFNAGSIAVHIIGVSFVERLNTDAGFALPYHRAEKKIACVDPVSGEKIAPEANNGVKLERFVFDALPLCEKSVVYETDRVEEFAPIKNADALAGEAKIVPDSPADCRRIPDASRGAVARESRRCGAAKAGRDAGLRSGDLGENRDGGARSGWGEAAAGRRAGRETRALTPSPPARGMGTSLRGPQARFTPRPHRSTQETPSRTE